MPKNTAASESSECGVCFKADEAFPHWRVRHVEQVYGKCGKFIDPKLEENKVDLFCWSGLYVNGVTGCENFLSTSRAILEIF